MFAKEAQSGWQRNLAGGPRWAHGLLPAAILAVTFLSYVATLAFGFVFDDHVLIVTNDSIRSWLSLQLFCLAHLEFSLPAPVVKCLRPFFLIWLRMNDGLFGQHAWGWHLSLVALHVAVTYLVYRLCLRLTRDTWSALAAALIFGLHPGHVETIAEAAWADQPLSALFVLAAILTFCRSREPGKTRGWLAASLGFTAAALLSKESAFMLPVLISGYAWIYGGGREVAPVESRLGIVTRLRSALIAAIPFWAVAMLYLPLRIRALKGFAHVVTPLASSQVVFTIPSVLLFYLRLLIWPLGLSCYYDTPYVSSPGWREFILPDAVLAAVAALLAFWYWRARVDAPEEARAIAFASLWMILILPVLNFRYLPESEIAHDRYLYLPSVGFAILAAVALRRGVRGFFRHPAWTLLGATVLCGAMGFATARQSLSWSDDLTLNFRAHEIAPRNVSATTSLAAAVAQRGMDGPAVALYQQALAIQPGFWRANVNLAYLYYAHGDFPEAALFFARACAADATDGDQFLYLGMSLLRMGRLAEAEKAVRTALLVRPRGKNYHLGLAMVLRGEGRLPEARQEVETELSEDGQNAQAISLLEDVTKQMKAQDATAPPARESKGRTPTIK